MNGVIKYLISIKSSHIVASLMTLGTIIWLGSGVIAENGKELQVNKTPVKNEKRLQFVRVINSVAQIRDQKLNLFGYTKAIKKADIAAEVDGRIIKKMVNKGDIIVQGQALYGLSMGDNINKLSEAKANLEYQKISYNAAKRLSKKQFQSRVTLAKIKAQLESAKYSLSAIELIIEKTTIRSPIKGSIDKLPLSIGDYVKSGEIVSVVVDLDPIKIVGEVSERDVGLIKIGHRVDAQLADGKELEGLIKYISKVGSSSTRTFTVDVWVNNPSATIQEGLTARMNLPMESGLAHFVSPAVLTLNNEGAIGVKAVNDENTVTFHRVNIIEDTTEGVWLEGLPERITLITVGQEYVMTGKKVRTKIDDEINSGVGDIQKENPLHGHAS